MNTGPPRAVAGIQPITLGSAVSVVRNDNRVTFCPRMRSRAPSTATQLRLRSRRAPARTLRNMSETAGTSCGTSITPVGSYAFMYETSDIPPGITLGEFRSQRHAKRRRRLRRFRRRPLSQLRTAVTEPASTQT